MLHSRHVARATQLMPFLRLRREWLAAVLAGVLYAQPFHTSPQRTAHQHSGA